jgi:uncharacterized protein with HEPN domain
MPRDYRVSLDDILEAAEAIREFTAGMTFEEFRKDRRTSHAVIRDLEVIGEAAKNVPEEVRNRYPEVEWKRMAGLRDILSHHYFGVNVEIVWDIVQNKLPALVEQVRRMTTQ